MQRLVFVLWFCVWTCDMSWKMDHLCFRQLHPVSDWAGGLRHKGTKEQIKIPYTATLLLFWSTIKKRHPLCNIQYNIYIYIYIYIFSLVCLFLPDAWVTVMIRTCRQFFLEGHGEKTIPKQYPNDTPKHNLRALGRRSPTHPHTWTKYWRTKCLGATYSHSIFHEWKQ